MLNIVTFNFLWAISCFFFFSVWFFVYFLRWGFSVYLWLLGTYFIDQAALELKDLLASVSQELYWRYTPPQLSYNFSFKHIHAKYFYLKKKKNIWQPNNELALLGKNGIAKGEFRCYNWKRGSWTGIRKIDILRVDKLRKVKVISFISEDTINLA